MREMPGASIDIKKRASALDLATQKEISELRAQLVENEKASAREVKALLQEVGRSPLTISILYTNAYICLGQRARVAGRIQDLSGR